MQRISTEDKRRIAETAATRCVEIIKQGFKADAYKAMCVSLKVARPDCWDDSLNEPTLSRPQIDELVERTRDAVKVELMNAQRRGEWSPNK